jgi:hypothetical protein
MSHLSIVTKHFEGIICHFCIEVMHSDQTLRRNKHTQQRKNRFGIYMYRSIFIYDEVFSIYIFFIKFKSSSLQDLLSL